MDSWSFSMPRWTVPRLRPNIEDRGTYHDCVSVNRFRRAGVPQAVHRIIRLPVALVFAGGMCYIFVSGEEEKAGGIERWCLIS